MSNNQSYGPNGSGSTPETRVFTKVDEWCIDAQMQQMFASCGRSDRDTPTVTFSVHVDLFNPADENNLIDLSEVVLRVQWQSGNTGCGSDCQQVDFDAINGSSGVIQASGLTLSYSYPGNAVSATSPALKINLSVAVGTAAKAGQGASLQRTIKVPVIAPAPQVFEFATLKIPDWAVCARLINRDITRPTIEFDQLQADNGIVVSVAQIGKGSVECVPIARGLGARWFTLTDPAILTEEFIGYAVQFDLCPN